MGDVLRLVFVHLLESTIASLLWRSMTNFEKMLGDIAICLSDMTSFATEWQPSEAALEACLPRKETATCGRCPYCCSAVAGLSLDDELVEGQDVEL
jgi:hypothetical protein